jgi:hypothetical protein
MLIQEPHKPVCFAVDCMVVDSVVVDRNSQVLEWPEKFNDFVPVTE